VPIDHTRIFTPARDRQASVTVNIYQGESRSAEGNELLGSFEFSGYTPGPRKETQIEVRFEINAEGIVKVSARDPRTGAEHATTISMSSSLSEDDLQRILSRNRSADVATLAQNALESEHELLDLPYDVESPMQAPVAAVAPAPVARAAAAITEAALGDDDSAVIPLDDDPVNASIAIDDAELSELITALPELESESALELESSGGLHLETAGGHPIATAGDDLDLELEAGLELETSEIDDDALAEQILEIERTSEPTGGTPDRSLFGSSENELTDLPSQEIEFDDDYEPAEIVLGAEDDDEAPV
jgi:hypothetical protein